MSSQMTDDDDVSKMLDIFDESFGDEKVSSGQSSNNASEARSGDLQEAKSSLAA
jgi:hypothetical protein